MLLNLSWREPVGEELEEEHTLALFAAARQLRR